MPAFFYHYNKPLSKQRGKHIMSLHYQGACHFVEGLECRAAAKTRINERRQPHVVMAGKAKKITIKNKYAVIE